MEMEEVVSPKQPPPPEETKSREIVVPINALGGFDFKDQMQLGVSASLAMQLALCPDHLAKEGKAAVMAALMVCKQYGLAASAMNHMAFIKGKLTTYGVLYMALAERHPDFGEKEEFFIDENCKQICVKNENLKAVPWAHVARVRKKNSTVWNEYFFSVDDAEQAGLLTKSTKPDSGWIKYTKDLLMHKNKNRWVNANYASAVAGLLYHEDVVEAIDRGNIRNVNPAEELNNL